MGHNVIGLGEVLWDLLPSGPQMGGAPANFAYHAHALGADARVITRIGQDELGQGILDRIKGVGLSSVGIQKDETAPTGTVTVALDTNGIPQYTIHENTAWDRIEATPEAMEETRNADAICFGSLAQRSPVSREAIRTLVAATPLNAWRVFDINLRQHFFSREIINNSLEQANVLKLNEDELPVIAELFALPPEPEQQIETLAALFKLRLVALTRGANGSLLYTEGNWSEHPSSSVDVVDTVGAGDAFTAALVLGLLHNDTLASIHAFASEVAGYVCTRAGAMPGLPEPMAHHYQNS